jgi:hypothetical protein
MIYIIPTPTGLLSFNQQVELDGMVYDLYFRWNARDQHWALTISTNGVVLFAGIKLVISSDLLEYARRIDNIPPGKLYIEDLDGFFRDPDGDLFGNRVVLKYEEASGA